MKSTLKLYQLTNTLFSNKFSFLFSNIKFTKNHQWVESNTQKKTVKVGITNYAQQQLGEIVHVELPTVGRTLKSGASAMTIESVKMAADVYTPVSGKVVSVNESISGTPGTVNEAAEKTWLFEVEYTEEPNDLLDAVQYEKLTKQQH